MTLPCRYRRIFVLVPLVTHDLVKLCERITQVINTVSNDMLSGVWQKIDNFIDACHVNKDTYIEHT